MDVSVVVSTYNRAHSLRYTLEALSVQTVPKDLSWELIVVNNNSSDDTPAVVNAAAAGFPVAVHHVFEPRQGISRARNAGIERAKGSIIVFTDDDVLPAPDWVSTVAHAIHRWNADVVGGRILPRWPAPVPKWLEASSALQVRLALMTHEAVAQLTTSMDVPAVWGANMAFRREIFEAGHRFDPALGQVGDKNYRGEDCRFIGSLLSAGHTVVYDPAILVWHRIQPERIRRAYFRRLCFEIGEGEGRVVDLRPGRKFLGAPLFYYRWTAIALVGCMAAILFRHHDAFERELEFRIALGRLWARWGLHFSSRGKERS